jgi:hypothetical protein
MRTDNEGETWLQPDIFEVRHKRTCRLRRRSNPLVRFTTLPADRNPVGDRGLSLSQKSRDSESSNIGTVTKAKSSLHRVGLVILDCIAKCIINLPHNCTCCTTDLGVVSNCWGCERRGMSKAIRLGKGFGPFQMSGKKDCTVLLVNVIGLDYLGTRWRKLYETSYVQYPIYRLRLQYITEMNCIPRGTTKSLLRFLNRFLVLPHFVDLEIAVLSW